MAILDFVTDEDQPRVSAGWLYRCEDRSPFAFAHGDAFIRCADHSRWARVRDAWLISERSGARLAYRVGNVFYDAMSDEPVYYQPSSVALPAQRPSGESGAVRVTREASPHRTANTESRHDQRHPDRSTLRSTDREPVCGG